MSVAAKQFAIDAGLLFEASRDADIHNPDYVQPVHNRYRDKGLLQYYPEYAHAQPPVFPSGKPRYAVPEPHRTESELLKVSQWFIFLGAVLSPQLLSLAKKSFVFVFDPCRARMDALLAQLPLPLLAQKTLFFFSGDIDALPEPLFDCVAPDFTEFGTPIFFAHGSVDGVYASQVADALEILYYHHQLYPYEVPANPMRKVASGYSFTHNRNLAENLSLLTHPEHGPVEVLRDICHGQPALIVAAGPELAQSLDTVKRLAPYCLVICVSKVCKTLLNHGITPDIVILMDTSDASAAELEGLQLPHSILVSYTLARPVVNLSFAHVLFFGQELEQIGLPANAIDHLGSVANFAFYLAPFMGCSKLVCAGLQLVSVENLATGYCSGCDPAGGQSRNWPCQVTVPTCDTPLYTSLNFMDAAYYLRATICREKLDVINLSKASLLFGPGITYNEQPEIAVSTVKLPLYELLQKRLPRLDALHRAAAPQLHAVLERMRGQWEAVRSLIEPLQQGDNADLPERFAPLLQCLDDSGISFQVQSHPDYDNEQFMLFFADFDHHTRCAAVDLYLSTLRKVVRAIQTALAGTQR